MEIQRFSVFERDILVLSDVDSDVHYSHSPTGIMDWLFVGPLMVCYFMKSKDSLLMSIPPKNITDENIQFFFDDEEGVYEVGECGSEKKRILVVVEKYDESIKLTFVTDPTVIGILTGEIHDRKEIKGATHKAIQIVLKAINEDSPEALDLLRRAIFEKVLAMKEK